MNTVYEIRKGSGERTWFVSFEKNEFWVWEPNKELGLYGDDKTFLTSEGPITVIGPWFGSRASMEKECA